ncbi:hypothetical protein [Rhizobium rhizogenes]|uniref:hypothetical protein n=1 Tax=Rhizobium rhizogenes TaxID=359 RepID=UPI0022CBEF44|nr:hypothetical protein [Rhizobium rhizogenes]MCZ7484504.1 hypothetical protein [Rhizobium rhizogenes]
MPTVIIVTGPGNTSKTTSIKLAMGMIGINMLNVGDITLDMPIYNKAGSINTGGIGFATGGDNAAILAANVRFFTGKALDCVVLACRSYGATLSAAQAYAASLGVTPVLISTSRQPAGTYGAYATSIARQIYANIP